MEIIPAILTNNPEELREKIEILTKSSRELVRRVQIDVIDGVFANNKTVELEAMADVDTDLLFDMQLMVKEPVDWVEKCIRVMGDRIIGQVELMSSQEEFIRKVAESDLEVGLGLDLASEINRIDEQIYADLDVVLVMGVKAGFGGQKFGGEEVIKKIKLLSEMRREKGYGFGISVDGGVNEDNILEIVEAGADEVVIGRRLWEGIGVEENLTQMYKLFE